MVTGRATVQTLGAEGKTCSVPIERDRALIGCLVELGLEHPAKHLAILILSLATASHLSLSASHSLCPAQRGKTAVCRLSIRP
jgi:hypothetical protein